MAEAPRPRHEAIPPRPPPTPSPPLFSPLPLSKAPAHAVPTPANSTKAKGQDLRLSVGVQVHTEAINVTNFSECARFLGSLAKTSFVTGTVLEVVKGKTKSGRNKTDLRVKWKWLDREVEKVLGLRSVKIGAAPSPASSQLPQRLEANSPASQPSSLLGAGAQLLDPAAARNFSPSLPRLTPASSSVVGTTLSLDGSAFPATLPTHSPGGLSSVATPTAAASQLVTAHALTWARRPVTEPVGGPVPRQAWSVRAITGEHILEGGDSIGPGVSRRPYDYFLTMFPPNQLVRMVRLTSAKLRSRGMQPTSTRELLKFIGVILLGTRFEFGARADLWATQARNRYLTAPAFGKRTGLSRSRFDAVWSCVTFSAQTGTASDASEQSRWQLIDDFVASINQHRAAHVTPSESICVDESMSRWYGQGGKWISRGLPAYVAIDRKPENGCEIQNAACGRSGIMLKLSVVTTAEYEKSAAGGNDADLPHGTTVLKRLVAPWAGTQRIICADSYFASVATAQQLLTMGLRFVGVVKTATRGYPMGALSAIPLQSRGQHVSFSLVNADNVKDLMAVLWVDRERRYFIA